MKDWLRHIGLIMFFVCLAGTVKGQEAAQPLSPDAEAMQQEIAARVAQFSDEFNQLLVVGKVDLSVTSDMGVSKSIITAIEQRMQTLNLTYNQLDVKWNTYYQAQQMDIANSEDLMNMVARIEELKQTVKDTLDAKDAMVKAISDFADADQFIISQVAVYKKLYKRAYKLSLIKKLAPQLEKAKARELLVFEKLQASYDAAKAATELVPSLQPRMNVLDEQFVVMKSVSEKVQALEYKPLFQRIKDYVMGLAAVSIILLFVSMMIARYKAYKDKLANLKKVNEMMNKQGKDAQYPMI